MRLVSAFLAALALSGVAACTPPAAVPAPTATATIMARYATVTDTSVPMDDTEADALVPRGRNGTGSLGRLVKGCSVEVQKTTDRAARVRIIACPNPDELTQALIRSQTQGWVAKSALDLSR